MPVVPFEQPLANRVVIPSDLLAARDVEEHLLSRIAALGYSREAIFGLRLALEEAVVNAHRHGNRGDSSRTITVSYEIDARRAVIRVADEGGGFDPGCVPDCTCPERLCLPHGRGLMLMRSYVDQVEYNPAGNVVQLVKEKS